MKKLFILSLIILFAISLLANEKQQAPQFELQNMKGEVVKLSDFSNKLVLLDFWATWCVPCLKELPHLSKLQSKYGEDIQVIAIDVDRPRSISKAKAYIKSNKFDFITLFDSNGEVTDLYNITNPPRTILISPEGEIIFEHDGYKRGDEKQLEAEIVKWISQKSSKSDIHSKKKSQPKLEEAKSESGNE